MGKAETLWAPKQLEEGPSRANLIVKVFVEICFFTSCRGELSGSFIEGHKDIDHLESSSFAG